MLSVTIKNLFFRKTRLALSVLAVALAMVLVLIIDGFAAGMYDRVTVFYRKVGANLMVVQGGVEGMRTSMSALPGPFRDKLKGVQGIDNVHEYLSIPTIFEMHGEKTPIYLVGYHPGEVGGPWRLADGRGVRNDDEVVLDLILARQNNVGIGDSVEIMGRRFIIVGLSLETSSWMSPFVFVAEGAAASLLRSGDAVSVFLVTVKPHVSVQNVRDNIENSFPEVDVFTPQQLANKERDILKGIMGNVLTLITTIAFGVGMLVVGLTAYTGVIERIADYGILKSIGAGNRSLYGMVFVQSIIITVLGYAIGALLSIYLATVIEALLPKFEIAIGRASLLRGAEAAAIMAIIAAYMPTRRIAAVDPSLVFRG